MITVNQSDNLRRRLRLRDLDTFMAVVSCGTMRKAALQLHMSQPAVSKAIADLEDALGVRLLDRSRRGVEPTMYGRTLLKHGTAMFDGLRQAVDEIDFLNDPSGGALSLGCAETISAGLTAAVIARMTRSHPRLAFNVESGEAPVLLLHFLRERSCELVIARPYADVDDDLEAMALFHERMTVVVGPKHRLAGRRKISLAELAEEPWLLSRNELMAGSPVTTAFARAGLELPTSRVITGSLNLRYALLGMGEFVTVVPHSLLRFGPRRVTLKLLPLELPAWPAPTCILTLKGRNLSPVAQLFIDVAREMTQDL
jgi:DNA-binding transcriptional LysR family regulator